MACSTSVTEFSSAADVLGRYQRPGPHATVVMTVPTPGSAVGDLPARWRAVRADLRHAGASDAILARLDEAITTLEPRGAPVLLSADAVSAAHCWLDETTGAPIIHVGDLPALLPALAAIDDQRVIGAVVDRIGADLYRLDRRRPEPAGVVDGDEEHVHKAAEGGWSQPRHQRHTEVVWERNATKVAAALATLAGTADAALALITGDERAAALTEMHLTRSHSIDVGVVAAGGRHEPDTPERLRVASREAMMRRRQRRIGGLLARLREELGQHDRAIAGTVPTLEAIAESRVGTLFLDPGPAGSPMADAVARAALEKGAEVVVVPDLGASIDSDDGVAALFRFAYG